MRAADNQVEDEFRPTVPLVHWNGKMLCDLTRKDVVDRLPVVVSGTGVEQLLGVPKLPSGTGDGQTTAVAKVLQDWGIVNRVCAMCCDTTSTNYGNVSCVLRNRNWRRTCRHHILEWLVFSRKVQ